jgi:hypothetical protein
MLTVQIDLRKLAAAGTALVVGAGLWVSTALSEGAVAAEGDSPKVQALQRERLGILREAQSQAKAAYEAGRATAAEYQEAARAAFEAEMAAADTPAQKLAAAVKLFEMEAHAESVAEARHKAGQGTSLELLSAKAARLEAQIEVEKARAAAEKK